MTNPNPESERRKLGGGLRDHSKTTISQKTYSIEMHCSKISGSVTELLGIVVPANTICSRTDGSGLGICTPGQSSPYAPWGESPMLLVTQNRLRNNSAHRSSYSGKLTPPPPVALITGLIKCIGCGAGKGETSCNICGHLHCSGGFDRSDPNRVVYASVCGHKYSYQINHNSTPAPAAPFIPPKPYINLNHSDNKGK